MKKNPRILVTNDDGIDAPGLQCLIDIARNISDDIWVVAPGSGQSGSGHRFTLGTELELTTLEDQRFSVDGTPADCVVAACTHILVDHPPEIVLSGVNNGQNMGDIVHCSGTVAAAREGALQGALGIAFSQAFDYQNRVGVSWDCVKFHGTSVLEQLIANAGGRDTYYNINFPTCAPNDVSGVQIVPHQRFDNSPFRHYPSKNPDRFFISIPEKPTPMEEGKDCHSLEHTLAITIAPLSLQLSNLAEIRRLEGSFDL